MKKWSGKILLGKEQSHWLVKKRKEPPEEAPLVVLKVIKQYTRKKRQELDVKKLVVVNPTEVTTTVPSGQSCSKIEFDNHIKFKDNMVEPGVEITNNNSNASNIIKTVQQTQKMEITTEAEPYKQENGPKLGIPNFENNSNKKKSYNSNNAKHKEENMYTNSMNTNGNSSDTKSVVKRIGEINNKVEPVENVETEQNEDNESVVKQDPEDILLQIESLNTEEVIIKQEIESDSDVDCELASTEKEGKASIDINEDSEVSKTEPAKATSGLADEVPEVSTTEGGDGKVDLDLIELKKCYLFAVNVSPANKVGTPENLPPLKVVAKSEIFTCDLCEKNFLSRKEVRAHVRAAHSLARAHQCGACPASFPHNYLLLAHLRTHTGKPPFCDLCPKRFKTMRNYSVHLNTHLRERLFTCPVCLRRFTKLDSLQLHASRHSPEDIFHCETCNETYRSLPDLKRHQEKIHKEKSPYPCYVCTRVLDSERDFYDHLASHANAVYECAFCPKRFTDAGRWEEHSADHVGKINTKKTFVNTPHDCEICHKRFMYVSTLKTHMRSHTAERPYSCGICSKKFKTRSALSEHDNSHKRPFACSECGARFGKRITLDRHYRLHSGERPYSCSTCGFVFAQRSSLLLHVRRQHTPGFQKTAKKKKLNKSAKAKTKKN